MRRITGLTAVLSTALSLSVSAEQVALSPDAMRLIAAQASEAGDHATALNYTAALLRRDPDDVDAIVLRSRAARDANKLSLARETAREAWAKADTKQEKFAAALVRAQALASGGSRTAAQFWLRRAIQVAPTEELRTSAVRDFRYVRARNRFQTHLSFSVAPVSNLNNGSIRETGTYTFPFFGTVEAELGGAARALSGLETATSVSTRYRFVDRPKNKSDLILSFSNRSYTLSKEAKEIVPDARDRDFDFTNLSVSLTHMGKFDAMPGPYKLAGSVSQAWYGGEEYTRTWRATARQDLIASKATSAYVSIGYSEQEPLGRTFPSNEYSYRTGLRHRLSQGHVIEVDASRAKSSSESSSLDFVQTELSASLTWGEPIFRLGWQIGADIGRTRHDGSMVVGLNRLENSTGASLTAVIEPLDMYGFVPTVTLEARKVDSNLGQYDREEFGLRLGLRSAF